MLHIFAKDGYVRLKQETEDRWRWSHKNVMLKTCCIAEYCWRICISGKKVSNSYQPQWL